MLLSNLYEGQTIKNYKELCKLLNIEVKTGNSKIKQLKKFSKYVTYHKVGNSFVVDIINKNSGEYIDLNKRERGSRYDGILTRKEIKSEFDGYYVYRHIQNDRVVYVGKGCRNRAIVGHGRKYKISSIETIDIVKRFTKEEDALKFEEQLINYYKSLGQCQYNDEKFRIGNHKLIIKRKKITKEEMFNKKINKQVEQMFKYAI